MAVDLADLIPSLQRETSPPGTDLFPDAGEEDWLGQLTDSFWEAKLFQFFGGYTSDVNGMVEPIDAAADDLSREDQQLIVLFAGIRSVRMKLMNTNTGFRAKAGPVEFETTNSANLLVEILKELQKKIDIIYAVLSSSLGQTQVYYFNSVVERTNSLLYGGEFNWGPGSGTGVYVL